MRPIIFQLSNRKRNILFNLVFWLSYFLYEWLSNSAWDDEYLQHFIHACMVIPTAMIAAWLSVHVLVRKFYFTNKKLFWISQVIVAVAVVLFRRGFNYYYTYPYYHPESLNQPFFFPLKILIELVNLYLFVFLYATFYLLRNWYEQQKVVQELKQQKTHAELELLKSQVQPHFIFNTLNNIYAVTVKKNPETAGYLLHLARFLEYNLYNTQQDFVSLESELAYIRDYVGLQELRYGNKVDFSASVYGSTEGIQLPPLLLLPLIENSFKHGVDSMEGNSWVRMEVSNREHELTVKIENSYEILPAKEGQNGGLGLKNVKKRLELIYPDQHELRVLNENNAFMVVLKIKKH